MQSLVKQANDSTIMKLLLRGRTRDRSLYEPGQCSNSHQAAGIESEKSLALLLQNSESVGTLAQSLKPKRDSSRVSQVP